MEAYTIKHASVEVADGGVCRLITSRVERSSPMTAEPSATIRLPWRPRMAAGRGWTPQFPGVRVAARGYSEVRLHP
jgi:hypothetical protein